MKKNLFFLLVFLLMFSGAFALDFYNRFSAASIIPLEDNAYNCVTGAGYGLKIIENRFVLIAGLNGYFGAADAAQGEDKVYGLYKKDWYITGQGEEASVSAVYMGAELSVSFGWHLSYLFERSQYIFITLAAALESENFSGEAKRQFLACRYRTYMTLSTEVFDISENPVLLDFSFGSAPLQSAAEPGNAFYFFKAGLVYEVPLEFKETIDTYKRSGEIKKTIEKPGEEEGGAIWEE